MMQFSGRDNLVLKTSNVRRLGNTDAQESQRTPKI